MAAMRIVLRTLLGGILGLIAGAALGVLAGIAWINLAGTSDFEGQSAMLVFFAFAPAGAIIGCIASAIWFGLAASRSRIRVEADV